MGYIGHRRLFNQLLSNFLVDNTRNLVIFLDERGFGDRYFRTLITLKTSLFKEDSSRPTSHFKVWNLRRFLEVIFLHWISAIRTRWGVVVQFSDDFLFYNKIGSIISIGDLPTTEVIESKKKPSRNDLAFLTSNLNSFQLQISQFLYRSGKSDKKRSNFYHKEKVESSRG